MLLLGKIKILNRENMLELDRTSCEMCFTYGMKKHLIAFELRLFYFYAATAVRKICYEVLRGSCVQPKN